MMKAVGKLALFKQKQYCEKGEVQDMVQHCKISATFSMPK